MVLTLFNTLTRRKQPFEPMTPGVVRMFVCGPTVYDLSHVGHAKTYTQFDFVARYLRQRGYRVTYAQNITDVDDKIIRRADELALEPRELARRFEAAYHEDMAALHNDSVDIHARAHDYIEQIVAQVQQLIDRGHAYQLDEGWYFDLSTFSDYGKLSGRTEVRPRTRWRGSTRTPASATPATSRCGRRASPASHTGIARWGRAGLGGISRTPQ